MLLNSELVKFESSFRNWLERGVGISSIEKVGRSYEGALQPQPFVRTRPDEKLLFDILITGVRTPENMETSDSIEEQTKLEKGEYKKNIRKE